MTSRATSFRVSDTHSPPLLSRNWSRRRTEAILPRRDFARMLKPCASWRPWMIMDGPRRSLDSSGNSAAAYISRMSLALPPCAWASVLPWRAMDGYENRGLVPA